MLSLSPQRLIASARSLVGTGPVAGVRHPALESPGGTRKSWDLQFIQQCGHASHTDAHDGESSWPIPNGVSYAELAQLGTDAGILHSSPAVGDIFLQYGPSRKTFVHAGIVMAVLASGRYSPRKRFRDVYTVEGDTGPHGQLYGGQILRVRRRLRPWAGDRLLRWVALDVSEQREEQVA